MDKHQIDLPGEEYELVMSAIEKQLQEEWTKIYCSKHPTNKINPKYGRCYRCYLKLKREREVSNNE